MQRRLTQMGMRPISLAVDVTNYVMLALGQPLHAYDIAKLSGSIDVRRARPGETLTTLDDVERALEPEDLLITDGGDAALGIAGVMGGATSEVSPTTTDVLIEAAHFDPVTVARSSRRHKLVTRGVEAVRARRRPGAAAGGRPALRGPAGRARRRDRRPGVTDVDETTPARHTSSTSPCPPGWSVSTTRGSAWSGSCAAEGCEVTDDGGTTVRVTPPTWRPDLVDGPDYAEEVARIDGYAKIPSIVRTPTSGRGLTHGQRVGASSPTRSRRGGSSRC